MLNGYNLCVVISSGRKQNLKILIELLKNHYDVIDEIRFWLNTIDESNINYIKEIAETNTNLYTIDILDDYSIFKKPYIGPLLSKTVTPFYNRCNDENTIYVKFDDDIVFIENDYIKDIAEFTINHKDNLLILGNIINNSVCDFNHKKYGNIHYDDDIIEDCFCKKSWKNPTYIKLKHDIAIDNIKTDNLDLYRFPSKDWYNRFSLNSMSWLGSNFNKNNIEVTENDEVYLTENGNFKNILYGNKICVHYSFYTQQKYMDELNYLDKYNSLVFNKK